MPAAVKKHLRDAMADNAGRCDFETRLFPLACQADRVIAARIVPIDVEHLDGARKFVVIPLKVKAMLNFLPPQGHCLVFVAHPRFDDAGYNLLDVSEIDATVGEPGIDHVGIPHVLNADRAV